MIDGVPKPRPLYVRRQITRHGRTVWYFRIGGGPRVRLPYGPGEPGFDAAYADALAGRNPQAQRPGRNGAAAGTLAWLVERYRETAAWTNLSKATRKQRECMLRQVLAVAGNQPVSRITRHSIVSGRDRRAATPFQARHFVDAMRGVFTWAVDAQLASNDPTAGVKYLKRPAREGFPPWEPADVAAFESRYPRGTRERVAFDVLRYTGLRRGDAAVLGRQHVRDGIIRINTAKNGERVTIRVADEVAATIEAGPVGELTFITGPKGKRFSKEGFGNWFREACRAAGITKSAHGLRKWYAEQLAYGGATTNELQAACGWKSGRMAELYTRKADRERLGIAASDRLKERTKKASPHGEGEAFFAISRGKSKT